MWHPCSKNQFEFNSPFDSLTCSVMLFPASFPHTRTLTVTRPHETYLFSNPGRNPNLGKFLDLFEVIQRGLHLL